MPMRPQDVVVAVKLALDSPQARPTYPELAAALEMSLSEVHGAVKRATLAGLVDVNRRANRAALLDFLVQGLRSAFVPKRGPLTRGMATAQGAPPLDKDVDLGAEPPPVWPDPDGTVRGESFEPLYRSVPKAAKKDPKLYEALCLVDALRGGRPRDRALAEKYLRKLILPTSSAESPSPVRFSLDEPRRRRMEEALSRTIGPGTAMFYRSALRLLLLEPPVEATSHLVAHLASEIESSLRTVVRDVMAVSPIASSDQSRAKRDASSEGRHADSIRSVLAWLDIPIDGQVGKDWIGLVGKDNDEGFHKRRHRNELASPRPIEVNFWVRFEGILATVLDAFEKKYVSVFERLDQLAAKTAPNEEDAKKLRGKIPQNLVAQGYFFGRLSEPAWIEPLEKIGFFARPPEPIRRPDGVEYPGWPALEYLARMVATRPDDVARIALAVPKTQNIHVCAGLAGIARSLPARLAEPFAERVDGWLDMDPSHSMAYPLEDNVVGLFENLAGEGCEPAALRVLAALLRPIPSPEEEDHRFSRRDPEARLPYWDLDRTMARLLPTIQKLGDPALEVLAGLLDQTLAMIHLNGSDAWEDYSWNWRKEIDEHGENHNGDLRAHLVSAIRDSAIRLVESNPARLADLVTLFEKRRWVFFRRLALFLLQRFQTVAPDAATSRILDRSYFDLSGPEYARLLRTCFKTLSKGRRETILSWIDDGPKLPELPGAYADQWRMRRFAVIAESLPEDRRKQYEALREKYGDVPAADAEPSSHELFVRPTSPFRDEELAQMTPTQVVDTIASWKPPSEFGSPDPEELSHTLERVVGQKPESFAAAAVDLKRLQPIYVPGALRGFAVAVRAGHAFDWKPVVDLCAWATSHPRKISSRKTPPFDDNTHWGNARFAALWLLSDAMSSNTVPIPIEARDGVWAAIAPTLDDPDGTQESEGEQGDPMFCSMNRVRGVAVRAAIDYALWFARTTASKGMSEEVRLVLERSFSDPSLAVRGTLVDRLHALANLDDGWCESHIRLLFKSDEQGRDIAWETYLKYERLFTLDVFRMLRWRYGVAIEILQSDVVLDKRSQKLAEAIGNHLARLYWHGKITFGDRDKLLDKFLSNAPASVTGEFMEDIGHWLHTDGQPAPEVIARLKALWAKRFAIERPEELAVFGWWFSSGCFQETWSIDNFLAALQTLDNLAGGFPPKFAPRVGERLADLGPRHLLKVVSCLELLVKANEGGWAILSLRVPARTILAAARTSDDNKVRNVAEATIGRLARKGYVEFRDLR
jgi:hypothetical protein